MTPPRDVSLILGFRACFRLDLELRSCLPTSVLDVSFFGAAAKNLAAHDTSKP